MNRLTPISPPTGNGSLLNSGGSRAWRPGKFMSTKNSTGFTSDFHHSPDGSIELDNSPKLASFIDAINRQNKYYASLRSIDENIYSIILNLIKYTQKLEFALRSKSKEIERLEYLNKYLTISQNKKEEILKQTIEVNRKLKEATSRIPTKIENMNMNRFPFNSSRIRNSYSSLNPKNSIAYTNLFNSEEKLNMSLSRSQNFMRGSKNLLGSLGDEKKTKSILRMTNDEVQMIYRENERLKLFENLIKDDDQFISKLTHLDQASYFNLCEAIHFITYEFKNLLYLVEKMKLLVKTATTMGSLSLIDSIEKIADETCACLECEKALVYIHDPEKNELWAKVPKTPDILRIASNSGIVGHVFTKSEILNIPDAYHDDRFDKENDRKYGYKTNNILCVPILDATDNPIGVLESINKQGQNTLFNKDDEGLLTILAGIAGLILKYTMSFDSTMMFHNNLRLALKVIILIFFNLALRLRNEYENTTFFSKFLAEGVGIELNSSLTYNGLIPIAEKKLCEFLGGEKAKIILLNEENNQLFCFNSNDDNIEYFPISCGLAGHVIQTGEMENIPNGYNHYLFNGKIDIETSMPLLCFPIRHNQTNKVIGVFEVINAKGLNGMLLNTQKPKIGIFSMEILDFYTKQLAQSLANVNKIEKIMGKNSNINTQKSLK